MKQEYKDTIIYWGKRVLVVAALILWVGVIAEISQSSAPFTEQAPYCMAGTMIIFGLLSAIFKTLDWWKERDYIDSK